MRTDARPRLPWRHGEGDSWSRPAEALGRGGKPSQPRRHGPVCRTRRPPPLPFCPVPWSSFGSLTLASGAGRGAVAPRAVRLARVTQFQTCGEHWANASCCEVPGALAAVSSTTTATQVYALFTTGVMKPGVPFPRQP